MRTLHSSKLSDPMCAPKILRANRSSACFASASPSALCRQSLVALDGAASSRPVPYQSGAAAARPPSADPVPAPAPPACSARSPDPPPSEAAWRSRWGHLTAFPLLDVPRMPHPFVRARAHGGGAPPAPLDALARWAAEELRKLVEVLR